MQKIIKMIITINEKEILKTPNDAELGAMIREKYFDIKERLTPKISSTYDICVECGKVSPYLYSDHIDQRIGYVEGAGQGCFQPKTCDKS